jgi:hypothetical protein
MDLLQACYFTPLSVIFPLTIPITASFTLSGSSAQVSSLLLQLASGYNRAIESLPDWPLNWLAIHRK